MHKSSLGTTLARLTAATLLWSVGFFSAVSAQPIYTGNGPLSGVTAATGLKGIPTGSDPRAVVISILSTILSFLSLAAVTTVIIAGIYLIIGLGSDDSRDKAKKIIQYTLIGLLIVLFSQVIVNLVTVYLASQV